MLAVAALAFSAEKPSPFRYKSQTQPQQKDSAAPAPKPSRRPEAKVDPNALEGMASFHGSAQNVSADAPLTAAHLALPIGSRAKVTNLANGKSVVVTVTSRGPFGGGRIISVNRRAAELLGFVSAGVARVRIDKLAE